MHARVILSLQMLQQHFMAAMQSQQAGAADKLAAHSAGMALCCTCCCYMSAVVLLRLWPHLRSFQLLWVPDEHAGHLTASQHFFVTFLQSSPLP
jgi:hypothetical protein